MKMISIGKAADMLGVHIDTLRQWDKAGKLKPVKTIGNHRRYRLDDIAALQSGRITGDVISDAVNTAVSSLLLALKPKEPTSTPDDWNLLGPL